MKQNQKARKSSDTETSKESAPSSWCIHDWATLPDPASTQFTHQNTHGSRETYSTCGISKYYWNKRKKILPSPWSLQKQKTESDRAKPKKSKKPVFSWLRKEWKKSDSNVKCFDLDLGRSPRVPAMLMLNILFRPVPRTHISFSKSFKFFLKL